MAKSDRNSNFDRDPESRISRTNDLASGDFGVDEAGITESGSADLDRDTPGDLPAGAGTTTRAKTQQVRKPSAQGKRGNQPER